ncbi:hypothetical protein [Dictyobacter aurantiacus]|uniref:General stress protein 17M-like domain-containing protein n=1 Tax=Dictyobacter aurantiacus TaxID=1936993 RepID=A0A401ZF24_9CHLR|nr:hypothetical protein [Dictyobacter aurantiacus]GCE05439.1 hypothetical protein KDAU_27680 [Dictyobacter aurantiacus]
MSTTERATAVGVFSEPALAEQAMDQLRNAGFTDEQIGFVSRDPDHASSDGIGDGGNAPSTATGAVSGGVIGGVIGAVTSLLIPGFGPAIAGGILAVTLGGAALGALAGGFVGSLMHLGVPEHEARFYESQLNEGRTVVTVNAPGRYDEAVRILRQAGAYDASVDANAPAIDNDRVGNANADADAETIPPIVYPAGLAGINSTAGTVNPGLPAAAALPAATPNVTDSLAGNNAPASDNDAGSAYGSAGTFSTKKSPEELREQERRLEREQGGDTSYADEETVQMRAARQHPAASSIADEKTVQMDAARQAPTATSIEDADTVILKNPGSNPGAAYGTDTTTPEYNGALPAPARSAYVGTDTTTPNTAGVNDPASRRSNQ